MSTNACDAGRVPTYSVVIPTYNRCRLLADAIDSVLLQACPAIDIVVVDDGSTDGSDAMLARRYPQVRYLRQCNQGPAAARNRGIREARGELVGFLDSDDVWLAHKVELELALLSRHPEADMLAGNFSAHVEGRLRAEDMFAQRGIRFDRQEPRYFDWSMQIMRTGPVCCTSSMTFRRATLQALTGPNGGPFDVSLRLDEDWDLEFRLFSGFRALLYPQPVCRTRMFDDGTRSYSITGRRKSPSEQRFIWAQQHMIISRYLGNTAWDLATAQGFQRRLSELTSLLAHGEEAAHQGE